MRFHVKIVYTLWAFTFKYTVALISMLHNDAMFLLYLPNDLIVQFI